MTIHIKLLVFASPTFFVFGCLLFILLGHTAAQKYRSSAFFPRFSHIPPDTTPFRVSLPRDRENCILLRLSILQPCTYMEIKRTLLFKPFSAGYHFMECKKRIKSLLPLGGNTQFQISVSFFLVFFRIKCFDHMHPIVMYAA